MSEKSGVIFDIKRFAIHDGPGIRTTIFLKGCPLKCSWCHNPEGISFSNEIFYYEYKCMRCNKCIDICNNKVNFNTKKGLKINRRKCTFCKMCIDICPTGARQIVGSRVTVRKIIREIEKDFIFYDESGGGVTFSGGEPVAQPKFLKTVIINLKKKKINTVIDTSGYASPEIFRSLIKYTDQFLYDLKILDDKEHIRYTSVSNKLIRKNLEFLNKNKKNIIIRFSIIPKITASYENIKDIIDFVSTLKNINEIDLLPFHNVYEKYKRLGKKYDLKNVRAPAKKKIQSIKDKFEKMGFYVKIGG